MDVYSSIGALILISYICHTIYRLFTSPPETKSTEAQQYDDNEQSTFLANWEKERQQNKSK